VNYHPSPEHKICVTCYPNHVENCHTCFGFGLRPPKDADSSQGVPISASEAMKWFSGEHIYGWWRCPECGGSPHNSHLTKQVIGEHEIAGEHRLNLTDAELVDESTTID
jgi:ribosomal protein L40E